MWRLASAHGRTCADAAAASAGVSPSMTMSRSSRPCSASHTSISRMSSGDPCLPSISICGTTPSQRRARAHRLRPRPDADDPDRDSLALRADHLGQVATLALVVKVASVIFRPTLPQRANQVDSLVEILRAHRQIDDLTGERQVGFDSPEPDGEDRAPGGELIECGDLARHLPRSAPRQWCQQGAELDAPRLRGHRRQQAPGVDAIRCLPDEDAVPAGLLGKDRLLELLGRRPTGEHHTEFHRPDTSFLMPGEAHRESSAQPIIAARPV